MKKVPVKDTLRVLMSHKFFFLLFAKQKNSEEIIPSLYKINFGSMNHQKFSFCEYKIIENNLDFNTIQLNFKITFK